MDNQTPFKKREMSSLRKYIGKQLVSFLRKDDYAHAGESEAIDLVFSFYNGHQFNNALDVGCGLGGTAHYIESKKYCTKISGFDIESEAISYANQHYKKIDFFTCDVIDISKFIESKFDILCLFNSFYAFSDQKTALSELFKVSADNGQMAIFDYSDPYIEKNTHLYRSGNDGKTPFIPIKVNSIEKLMNDTGWKLLKIDNITHKYHLWYSQLCELLINNKSEVIKNFNETAYNNALSTYDNLRRALSKNELGGTVIYAERL